MFKCEDWGIRYSNPYELCLYKRLNKYFYRLCILQVEMWFYIFIYVIVSPCLLQIGSGLSECYWSLVSCVQRQSWHWLVYMRVASRTPVWYLSSTLDLRLYLVRLVLELIDFFNGIHSSLVVLRLSVFSPGFLDSLIWPLYLITDWPISVRYTETRPFTFTSLCLYCERLQLAIRFRTLANYMLC